MIQPNKSMKTLLQQYEIGVDDVPENNAYPIWKKQDRAGRPYWGISELYHLDQNGVPASEDLSRLEWDGNEVCLDACCKDRIQGILREAIGIAKTWKRQLEHDEPDMLFLILASYDNGADLVNKEDCPDGLFSITLRFWAPRGMNTVVDLRHFEDWEQPAFLACCGECAGAL